MSDKRPVLVGMNNPVSSEPEHALFPYPPGCTGHRIFQMLETRVPDLRRKQYLDAFDRRNVVPFKSYDNRLAKEGAARLTKEFWGSGRTIVVLGADTAVAFALPRLLIHPQIIGGSTWRQIPHPSGRNLWYNDDNNRLLVATLLHELYEESLRNALQVS